MIHELTLIPTTEASHPFARAEKACALGARGYVEEEYFLNGAANLYDEPEPNRLTTLCSDAPYVNRLLIRRPKDGAPTSGTIVLEILNPTARMDIDRMWVNSWPLFTRNGDIYVGITSKPDVLKSLTDFDAERYAKIRWDNPLPGRPAPEKQGIFGFEPRYETGLFWDMLTDTAKLLASDKPMNPLRAIANKKLFLTGWSQSAGYVMRYLQTFAPLMGEELFAGYLSAGGGAKPAPINSYAPLHADFMRSEGAAVAGANAPFIALNTESENTLVNWAGDGDAPGQLLRVYEIAGASHDSQYNLLTYYLGDADTEKIGMKPMYHGVDGPPNDYPAEPLYNAAWRNLFEWARSGIPAPRAPRISQKNRAENRKDAFGNAIGGLRTAAIDLPTARYESYSMMKDGRRNWLFGHIQPLESCVLKALYGGAEHYRERVRENTALRVAEGLFVREDAEAFVERVVAMAIERGL